MSEEKVSEQKEMEARVAGSNLPALLNAMTDDKKINLAKFNDGQRQKINDIVSTSGSGLDSGFVDNFGVEPQRGFNSLLDQLLQGIKTNEVGYAGELTIELAKQIKAMNLPKMKEEAEGGDWLAKIPLVGKLASAIHHFQLVHQEVLTHIKEIEDKATRKRAELVAMNSKLDQLADRSIDNLSDLELYLAAGQAILMRARADFNKRKDEATKSNDPIALTKLRDFAEQINAFEARLLKMHIAFTRSMASIPEIRINQEAARIEARNILDTLLFDLPGLKSAILRVASLQKIIAASKEDEARREITRQIGTIGADTLDEAYRRAKQSQGSGVEDVAALAATADKLLETIAKGVRFDEENRQKREAAEQQLGDIKSKLVEGLRANAIDMANRSV
jgi:uncharacterized protein YaaN involved in tellurite resistance